MSDETSTSSSSNKKTRHSDSANEELETDSPNKDTKATLDPIEIPPTSKNHRVPASSSEPIWPLKIKKFRAKYDPNKISIQEEIPSDHPSVDSLMTVIETGISEKSESNSCSSRSSIFLKVPLPSNLGWENQIVYSTKVVKIGTWEIIYDVDSKKPNSCIESFKGFMRTGICKITMCFLFGLIFPSILVVLGFLYGDIHDNSKIMKADK